MNLNLYRGADRGGLMWTDRVIDIVDALDLVDSCVRDRGEDYRALPRRLAAVSPIKPKAEAPGVSDSIVTLALRKAGAPLTVLSALAHAPVADVYASGRPDLNLTLGAVVVFRAAESAERRGQTWAMSRQAALQAAARFVELIPDRVAARAAGAVTAPDRGASLAQHVNRARTT
jgi:hypothetical protein